MAGQTGSGSKRANPASGRGARATAAPLVEEDMSKLVPCPIITAHPNGFVERTEPERELSLIHISEPTRPY